MAEKMLKITLVKSPIGAVPKHRATVKAMGLTKMHKTAGRAVRRALRRRRDYRRRTGLRAAD